ncbi:DNA binding domain-containing protein, excisionase family [Dehalogenimonas formicexedens]|uniref:DNA binding domain-containing protein, excisionase family n=1 Tax=Dehalogenimonas formicexedens TaxID=1839801 RepID=A0A1P8FAF5_9CHLR|nr:helix-turn-helix domain-containing protein [Dehalogenimonas formicexedens]APV45439.1 DNA binding domain-containing protein, excisionase family [Dehalogenimonas formicexedens]
MNTSNFTIAQAADKLGVSTRTIRRYIKSGKLRADLVNGPFGEEYRIRELPEDLKKLETPDPWTALEKRDPLAGASQDAIAVLRDLQEKNLALAAQLGAATERIRQLESQLKTKSITDGQSPKTAWWQKIFSGIRSLFSHKTEQPMVVESTEPETVSKTPEPAV